ncbi:tyrosine-type recombinase/integrase [Novosphingobium sp. KCTC 2891]|uniref:tyrosine-type recombinase/integrase n=1 Tax=unclassified Novosphingobium TaxID=2644732 RepID=UPI002221F24A|nr:site-specific integrase [Novosphingobium sp. KCTC 2891]MCW1384847.1 tyrosine-type recombinase/integrase [Novosphingobium sp. KCTC 2891]
MGNLTALKVRNLKEPGRYSDGDGLILDLAGAGKGSWMLRIQIAGKRRDIGLGSLDFVSLAEARDAAAELRKQARAGLDPLLERKKAQRKVPTFKAAALRVFDEHKSTWKNGKHQVQWLRTLETYAFPALGDLLVSDVDGPMIRDVLAKIWLSKPETARRLRQRIGAVLDWAYAEGHRSSEAPLRSLARGLPKQPRKDRHFAAMPFSEISAFLTTLRQRCTVSRLALEFLILTASRSGEVRGAAWAEFDLTRKIWSIPAGRMKAGEAHQVPLSEGAIDVIQRAKRYKAERCDLVFPGQKSRKPLSDMTLLAILRKMDLDYTVHGFRSAFRDWAAEETSYPGEVAEAALAHTVSNKVEAAYRRTKYLEKRKGLMADWGRYCLS